MRDSQPTVAVRDLAIRRGETRALDEITFDVATGELSGSLGRDAAGRNATIRILTALLGDAAGPPSRTPSRRRPSRR